MTTEGYAGQEINKVTEVLEAATERETRKDAMPVALRCRELSFVLRGRNTRCDARADISLQSSLSSCRTPCSGAGTIKKFVNTVKRERARAVVSALLRSKADVVRSPVPNGGTIWSIDRGYVRMIMV